jgi:microsomal dipeptidase-like Zn-dependent dipeptidase
VESKMNRRQFLRSSALCGLSLSLGSVFPFTQTFSASTSDKAFLKGLQIIDAHAHPDRYVFDSRQIDYSSTLKAIQELGMVASSFSAVGDQVYLRRGRQPGTEYSSTKTQLEHWIKGPIRQGKVKLILKASDIPDAVGENTPPGSILAIEGGDALEGNPDKVNEFYNLGVRMITLVHYRNNELGDIMRAYGNLDPGPRHNGLTPKGRKVLERMQQLGMLVDVAHVHTTTLKQIVEMSGKPLVDSHTSPCATDEPSGCGRLRTWEDMELIANTGGIICTWPLAYSGAGASRMSFLDWAKEILEMKKRLGMDHMGLGTDGAGALPKFIEGYRDIRDLVRLVAAMQGVGLSQEDIKAYMGGSFYRVLQSCIG